MRVVSISPIAFALYLVCTFGFSACAGVLFGGWWSVRKEAGYEQAAQLTFLRALLFAECAIATSFAALSTAPHAIIPVDVALWGVRIMWAFILSSSIMLTDLSLAKLNGKSAGVYRLWRWWERLPKGKLLTYAILFAVLWIVASCADAKAQPSYQDFDLVCRMPPDPCYPSLTVEVYQL